MQLLMKPQKSDLVERFLISLSVGLCAIAAVASFFVTEPRKAVICILIGAGLVGIVLALKTRPLGVARFALYAAVFVPAFTFLPLMGAISGLTNPHKATPQGPLQVTVTKNTESPAAKSVVEADRSLVEEATSQMPKQWVVRGQYQQIDDETLVFNNWQTPINENKPTARVFVRPADVPNKASLWIGHIVAALAISIAGLLAFALANRVAADGPFAPRVYQLLFAMSAIGLAGGWLGSEIIVQTTEHAIQSLDFAKYGYLATADAPERPTWAWLTLIGVAVLLWLASAIKQENDETV